MHVDQSNVKVSFNGDMIHFSNTISARLAVPKRLLKKKAERGYNSAFSIKGWRYDSCLYLVYNNNITNILCQPTI